MTNETVMTTTKQTGDLYEERAVNYLKTMGYNIIERNFRCCYGEIDIIAVKDHLFVFTEVKVRRGSFSGSAGSAISYQKQRKIRITARYFLMTQNLQEWPPCRFDAALFENGRLSYIENAFEGGMINE